MIQSVVALWSYNVVQGVGSIYHMSDDFKIRSLQFQFFNLEWGSVQTAKAFESAWHLCIYEKRSSILLIFHIDNVVQQAKLQGRRNWVGGQRGAIVPQILINKLTLSRED